MPPSPSSPSEQPASLRILVVERDAAVTDLISTVLEWEGHQVYSARNAAEGMALAVQHLPDAIFSGIELPDVNGFVFAAQIRSTPPIATCLLVALTGHGKESDVELGRVIGFDHFLIKPVSIDAILATLAPVRPKVRHSAERRPDRLRP